MHFVNKEPKDKRDDFVSKLKTNKIWSLTDFGNALKSFLLSSNSIFALSVIQFLNFSIKVILNIYRLNQIIFITFKTTCYDKNDYLRQILDDK